MNTKRKLDIDATREGMTALGLRHAAGQLEPRVNEAVKAGHHAARPLDQLLEAEYLGRERRRVRTTATLQPPHRADARRL